MRFAAPPITDLRSSRLHRWVQLWLKWLGCFLRGAAAFAPLSREAEAIAHHWLDRVERLVVTLVLIRGRHFYAPRSLAPAPAYRGFAVKRIGRGFRRALVGARLRRALRRKTLAARIEALCQSLGALLALWLKSRPHALTRRRPLLARRSASVLAFAAAPLAAPAAADTS